MSQAIAKPIDEFPSTHWSLIGEGRSGLSTLFKRYRPAMVAYMLRAYQFDSHRAEDMVQGFAASHLVEKDFMAKADRNRGRFRALLVTAMDHFVLNQLRDERREKRRPIGGLKALDQVEQRESSDDDPVRAYEREWARQVVAQAVLRTQQECLAAGRSDLWGLFEQRFLTPLLEGGEAPEYEHLILPLGVATPSQASNLLITGKRMFARLLREVIAEYTQDRAEVEVEIHDLMEILSR